MGYVLKLWSMICVQLKHITFDNFWVGPALRQAELPNLIIILMKLSHGNIHFCVSRFVQSQQIKPHDWIGLDNLLQNDPLNAKFYPLDQKLLIHPIAFLSHPLDLLVLFLSR